MTVGKSPRSLKPDQPNKIFIMPLEEDFSESSLKDKIDFNVSSSDSSSDTEDSGLTIERK